jgi:uncharacterized membrane protein
MDTDQEKLKELSAKFAALKTRQAEFSQLIGELQYELDQLKLNSSRKQQEGKVKQDPQATFTDSTVLAQQVHDEQAEKPEIKVETKESTKHRRPNFGIRKDLEKFIGENLINKIGIVILVIGVAIGAKYSIENELISPLTRIILGYLAGIGLLGFGFKLKEKYDNFSAVLVSGAIAVMYFITFSAYAFYDLIPQVMAFVLMLVFTVFTVFAAINYNKQIIAHMGFVGAYAVPFLLSNGSGAVMTLFVYMTIINSGILIIAFKKYWKALNVSAFIFTWLIFIAWYLTKYNDNEYFTLAMAFATVFFVQFYLTSLAYKLIKKEKFSARDVVLITSNSFLYFGMGTLLLGDNSVMKDFIGLFTLFNAIIHFVVTAVVFRMKLADRNLFYMISGLVLVFVTIAVQIQLDGNWVTLFWVGEAALLFWIGRKQSVSFYEKLSYILMLLAFYSLVVHWNMLYNHSHYETQVATFTPLFNSGFLTSILFIAALSFINMINFKKSLLQRVKLSKGTINVVSYALPAILVFVVYHAFRLEIEAYWGQRIIDSLIIIENESEIRNYNLNDFSTIWVVNYSMLFASILTFISMKKVSNHLFGLISLGLSALTIIAFLTSGLFAISELRESYLLQENSNYYNINYQYIAIRYISMAFVALALFICYLFIKRKGLQKKLGIPFDFLMHSTILWLASSELIHWMDMSDSSGSYKLGLSILFGIYALILISLGIWKKKKQLRIGAIGLFAITLIKLFFYDISHLDTISKTVVFVSLGILLLIISFLYNKYKHIITDEAQR